MYNSLQITSIIYYNYSSNTKGPNYGLLCRYLLLKYKSWCNVLDDAWCNEKASDSVYINQWHIYLQTPDAQFFVPNWSQQINSISEYVQQLVNNDDYIESDTGEREEWMIIVDMKLQSDNGNKLRLNCLSDFYAQDRLKYTAQEIGDMPHWINMQKKGDNLRKETTPTRVNIKKFNDAQRIAYNIVQDHFISENKEPLLMMITGLV